MNFDETLHRVIGITLTVCGFMVATVGPIVVTLSKDPNVSGNATLVKMLAYVGAIIGVCGTIQTALKHWSDTQIKLATLKLKPETVWNVHSEVCPKEDLK